MNWPTSAAINAARQSLGEFIRNTPVLTLPMRDLDSTWPNDAEAVVKLELHQNTGTFKVRGALFGLMSLSNEQRARGVTAVSAGNHAIAVAYAAKVLGLSAKVIMLKTANALRIQLAQSYGAVVELAEDGMAAFARVKQIEEQEGRYFVHPFEGLGPVTGSATLGSEWLEQASNLDAVVIACGGGGLLAGVSVAFKHASPGTAICGVEPAGANGMFCSLQQGAPLTLPSVRTIADSLAPPMTTPYTFEICRQLVHDMVLVSDDEIREAMRVTFRVLKLAVEPAGAAALAGVLTPLRGRLKGARRIGVLVCGSNIDSESFCKHLHA